MKSWIMDETWFFIKKASAFCGNFCFLGLKNGISENQDLCICLYCLRDSWGLYFRCFICLHGLCSAGKSAILNESWDDIVMVHHFMEIAAQIQRACLDSILCSCSTHAVQHTEHWGSDNWQPLVFGETSFVSFHGVRVLIYLFQLLFEHISQ